MSNDWIWRHKIKGLVLTKIAEYLSNGTGIEAREPIRQQREVGHTSGPWTVNSLRTTGRHARLPIYRSRRCRTSREHVCIECLNESRIPTPTDPTMVSRMVEATLFMVVSAC